MYPSWADVLAVIMRTVYFNISQHGHISKTSIGNLTPGSVYKCSCHTSHSSRSFLPQDSGFPSGSTLLLPLFCTTRASAHSPHHTERRADSTHSHTHKETTQGKETKQERENHEGEINMGDEKLNAQIGSLTKKNKKLKMIWIGTEKSESSWRLTSLFFLVPFYF